MTDEDYEFNRIERESLMRMEAVKAAAPKEKDMSKEAIKLALEALEKAHHAMQVDPAQDQVEEAITALRQALAKQPAQRKPLTDEEIWREYRFLWPFHPEEERKLASDILMFARAIEAKLKEKNNG